MVLAILCLAVLQVVEACGAESPAPPPHRPLPKVLVLAIGGTIASSAPTPSQVVDYRVTQSVEALIASIPALKEIAQISGEQVANIASGDIDTPLLLELAGRINAALTQSDINGVVVTQGTDTLEETAYFLDLVVKSRKPVVVTGAMRPGSALSADGPLNLFNAVQIAGSPAACERGVLVVLNDRILSARDAAKADTTATNTFQGGEQGYLGAIVGGQLSFYHQPVRRHTFNSEFDISGLKALPRVDIVYEYQGSEGTLFAPLVQVGTKGIVVAGVGNGSLSAASARAAATAIAAGVSVVRSSRTGSGVVSPSVDDQPNGWVSADSLNPQKARILLMLALSRGYGREAIQRCFVEY